MVFRLTWIASFALLGLVILRLSRLFLPTDTGLPWQGIAIIAATFGVIITWASFKARLGAFAIVLAHTLLFGIFGYLYVGGELSDSTFPPIGVAGDIFAEVSDALTIFRFSSPPVTPLAGIVVLAALMVWALSAVATWGLLNNSPYLSVVPPVVFYLQLAVIDRQPTGMLWTTALLLLVGAGLASIATDQRAVGGHAGHGRQAAKVQVFVVPVLAIVAVTTVSVLATRQAVRTDAVPSTGVLDWTNRSGIGGGIGSVSYNPFIDVRRSLVSGSPTPVFSATVVGDIPDRDIYWQLRTMDSFNGDWWYASGDDLEDLEETTWEKEDYEFRGDTIQTTQDITILQLAEDVLPVVYSPVGISSEERIIAKTTRVDPLDGSLHIDGITSRGMRYQIVSQIPNVDVAVLAADESGQSLSPLFQAAALEGRFQPAPAPSGSVSEPRDLDRYLQLPRTFDRTNEMTELAQEITFGLETDYEKALALEHFFRDPALFRYSTNVAPNERDSGLLDWLLNPNSPGYRVGYCEQFSASMGVLARLLGIPTRTVLGFTPGEPRSDGTVLVRDRNAHAWVEVWLPTQGWVRFDPTPRGDGVNPTNFETTGFSSADLDRYFTQIEEAARRGQDGPGGGGQTPFRNPNLEDLNRIPGGGNGADGGGPDFTLPSWLTPAVVWTIAGAILLGTVPTLKRIRRRRRMRRLEEGDITAAWAEMVDRLIDSGVGMHHADTPLEVAEATDAAMHPLAAVYSESVYGPNGAVGTQSRETAASSLSATEHRLRAGESSWQRLRRTYRVRSLLPDWIKRARIR